MLPIADNIVRTCASLCNRQSATTDQTEEVMKRTILK